MRHKILVIAVIVLFLVSFGGCFSIQYVQNGEEVQGRKRIVYLFWGLTPVTNNAVKAGQPVQERFTAVDYIIQFFTLGIVASRTVEAK